MHQFKFSKIQKRDERVVEFEPEKITKAIFKAFAAAGQGDRSLAENLSGQVVELIEEHYGGKTPNVENVQDVVENVLIKNGYTDIAKRYILYRQKRSEIRDAKRLFGVSDDLKLTVNAIKVLRKRYLLKNDRGEVIETPGQMFHRVAKALAAVDGLCGGNKDIGKTEEEFYLAMANLEFLPNSPTLMNAGTNAGQLSACFVIPVEDSITGIFEAVQNMALIHKSGGGTGFSFSKLRPKGDTVKSTMGIASGPISFMSIFDIATDVVKQGGRRRGANMGLLRVDHPDIEEFIEAKTKESFLSNFNLSVAITDEFMRAVDDDTEYALINPRTGTVVKNIRAKAVFNLIVTSAWKTGDPGVIFIDEINRYNPTPQIGEIASTNPCGEQPLLPYESCNLGSINIHSMIKNGEIDWGKLTKTVRTSVHFLDNVIDANVFPLPQIEKMTKANRKIGLGIMGLAETFLALGIPYDSKEALELSEKMINHVSDEAKKASSEIAEEKGSFPNFEGSLWPSRNYTCMRNATITTIAPTGTISIVAGITSGIEPLFAISYIRDVMEGTRLLEVNQIFEKVAKERGFYSQDLMMKIAKSGSIQGMNEIPEDVRRIFTTALDMDPEWHVRMQA
ncbi:MAG: adenosylcobalamin-dependent ribonucleoside-diphosphate reductase, partial [Candidatus Bathyarchaeota archaeon]